MGGPQPADAPRVSRGRLSGGRRPVQGVGETDLDERLSCDAEAASLLVDLTQQIDREVHVDTLDRPAGTDGLAKLHVCAKIDARVVLRVELRSGEPPSLRGTQLLLHGVLAEPR